IWNDLSNPLLAGLKQHPRKLEGRCGACRYLAICNGSSRVRAEQVTGNPWAEDPACYLDDDEIGVSAADYGAERVVTTPWTRINKVSA
ncbi:MAG: heme d1 biosynthesis radical SAM protein NirJ, partial [Gammaproteobacteria bacterium]